MCQSRHRSKNRTHFLFRHETKQIVWLYRQFIRINCQCSPRNHRRVFLYKNRYHSAYRQWHLLLGLILKIRQKITLIISNCQRFAFFARLALIQGVWTIRVKCHWRFGWTLCFVMALKNHSVLFLPSYRHRACEIIEKYEIFGHHLQHFVFPPADAFSLENLYQLTIEMWSSAKKSINLLCYTQNVRWWYQKRPGHVSVIAHWYCIVH